MSEQEVIAAVRAADVAAGLPACRVCSCTDNAGCDPPCWWIERDLCSSCRRADLMAAAVEERNATTRAKIYLGYPITRESV